MVSNNVALTYRRRASAQNSDQYTRSMYSGAWHGSSHPVITTLLMSTECNIMVTKMGRCHRARDDQTAASSVSINHAYRLVGVGARLLLLSRLSRHTIIHSSSSSSSSGWMTIPPLLLLLLQFCWHRRHDDVLMNHGLMESGPKVYIP